MKLSFISLVLSAGLAISQVSASPLRVIVVSNGEAALPPRVRIGSPITATQGLPGVPTYHSLAVASAEMSQEPKRMGCMKHKAMQATNWIRVTAGLPPLDPKTYMSGAIAIGAKPASLDQQMTHYGHHGHHHHHNNNHHSVKFHIKYHSQAFIDRLTRALMMLGPWEGRAVAFVLGCGLGALLRMVWALSVITFRAIKGRPQEDEILDVIIFEEEEQEHLLPPPQYEQSQVLRDVKEKVEN